MPWAVANRKPSFAGAVNQMRGSAKIARQRRILLNRLKGPRSSAVTVLANQHIDCCVLSKLMHAGCKHDQFSVIGKRHPCPVDALVPQPGAAKLMWIEKDYS